MKKALTTLMMVAVLAFSTTFANAGIIIAGLSDKGDDPCKAPVEKVDNGIIIAGFTGIIIAGFTGIIIAGAADQPTVDCGIIIAG